MSVADRINAAARKLPTAAIYVAGLGYIGWLFWLGLSGGLGPEPIKALEHRYGLIGLQCLLAGLCISPLRRFAGINLLRFRRAIGLIAFFCILAHLLVWLVLDVQIPAEIWKDIIKRPYITIGMAGFIALLPLAATSNNWSVRRLGPLRWRLLHRLTYLAVMLGAVHYVMLVKGWQAQPLVYMGCAIALLGMRVASLRRAQTRPV